MARAPIGTLRSIPPGAIHPSKVVGQPLKEHTCLPRKVEVGDTLYFYNLRSGGYPHKGGVLCKIFAI